VPKLFLSLQKVQSVDPLDMMADEFVDDASETGSLLGVKKRSRVKNTWFDDEADDDVGEVGEQGGDEDDDENTTGKAQCSGHVSLKHFKFTYMLCFLDLGKIKAELAGPMGLDIEDNPMQDDVKSVTTETNIAPVVIQQPQTIQQQPFQPGSTPAHLMHRFMVRFITI
jgi:hypothetical protein